VRQVLTLANILIFLTVFISQECFCWPLGPAECSVENNCTEEKSCTSTGTFCSISKQEAPPPKTCCPSQPVQKPPDRSKSNPCRPIAAETGCSAIHTVTREGNCCTRECILLSIGSLIIGDSVTNPDFFINLFSEYTLIRSKSEINENFSYSLPQGIHNSISSMVLIC